MGTKEHADGMIHAIVDLFSKGNIASYLPSPSWEAGNEIGYSMAKKSGFTDEQAKWVACQAGNYMSLSQGKRIREVPPEPVWDVEE
jgi:hypothetical protein